MQVWVMKKVHEIDKDDFKLLSEVDLKKRHQWFLSKSGILLQR